MTDSSFSCHYTLAADILKLPNIVTFSTERQVCTVIPHFRYRNVPGEYTREVEGFKNNYHLCYFLLYKLNFYVAGLSLKQWFSNQSEPVLPLNFKKFLYFLSSFRATGKSAQKAQVHSLTPDTSPLLKFSLLIVRFLEVPLLPLMSQN